MKEEKGGEQDAQENAQSLAKENKEHRGKGSVNVPRPEDRLQHCPNNHLQNNDTVQEEQEEVLVVLETNAIVDPRAMMVHLQNACPAYSAMVATVRLELGTPFAMASVT